MFDQAQLRKGTLEGCILKIIDREPTYGYAIATTLRDSGFADLTEGTLYTVLGRPWDCHYDAVWLVLCIAIMMPSAWLLQRIVPAEWAASTEKGVRYGAITAAMLFLWFVEFWFVDKWITPLLPAVGLPNLAAVILFGAALAALLIWRNHRRNELAEKRPWRDVMEK